MIGRRAVCAGVAGGAVIAANASLAACGSARSAERDIDLSDFGVAPGATPRQNLDRFRKAVASALPGARLRLPRGGGRACLIDTSGGWQAAVQIDKPLILHIDGELRATHSGVRTNPPFILNVTAPGVTIAGSGRIVGDGAIDDTNGGTDETIPGLIRVAADDFVMRDVEIVTPPKVGLLLYQCRRARIADVRFAGGPRVYGDTGHFAIRAAGGGEHRFERNRFYPAADGGMCVQCIMLTSSDGNLIANNHATHPYEKLVYGFGDRNVARDNVVVGNPGFIPGTNIQGTITAVFRFHGSHNRVAANRTSDCAGGAQMMDGTAHAVVGNRFLGCGQSAISAYQSDLSGSVFTDNLGTRGTLVGFLVGDGMRLMSDRAAARGVVVQGNDITGFSMADPIAMIAAWRQGARFGRNSIVKPTTGNGRLYEARTGGVAGAREPLWPTAPGATVIDGSIRWVAVPYEGGQAEIKLAGRGAAQPIVDAVIRRNRIGGGRLGIVTQFVTRSTIAENRISASDWAMVEDAGHRNSWRGNVVAGTAQRAVRTLDATSVQE